MAACAEADSRHRLHLRRNCVFAVNNLVDRRIDGRRPAYGRYAGAGSSRLSTWGPKNATPRIVLLEF